MPTGVYMYTSATVLQVRVVLRQVQRESRSRSRRPCWQECGPSVALSWRSSSTDWSIEFIVMAYPLSGVSLGEGTRILASWRRANREAAAIVVQTLLADTALLLPRTPRVPGWAAVAAQATVDFSSKAHRWPERRNNALRLWSEGW
jgi:type IV secretory pathway VirJ component